MSSASAKKIPEGSRQHSYRRNFPSFTLKTRKVASGGGYLPQSFQLPARNLVAGNCDDSEEDNTSKGSFLSGFFRKASLRSLRREISLRSVQTDKRNQPDAPTDGVSPCLTLKKEIPLGLLGVDDNSLEGHAHLPEEKVSVEAFVPPDFITIIVQHDTWKTEI